MSCTFRRRQQTDHGPVANWRSATRVCLGKCRLRHTVGAVEISDAGMRTMAKKDYVAGTGNVFEDLGHRRTAEALAKAKLVRKIGALIGKRRLTQAAAAEVLQIDQPKVSALVRGRLAGFSLDRQVRFLVSRERRRDRGEAMRQSNRPGPGQGRLSGRAGGRSASPVPTRSVRNRALPAFRISEVLPT
jgi:predicted XRE-type DNA-binding protein